MINVGNYAPSGQFIVIALSLLLSGGLVYGAQLITHPSTSSANLNTTYPAQPNDSEHWEAALYAIQAQNASSSFSAPNQQSVQQMLAEAQSSNLTETVGKTLLINLSNAKSQGLGDDIPTQDQIIAAAAAQISPSKGTLYSLANLVSVNDSDASLKAYGNGVIEILNNHPLASEQATLIAIDTATTKNNPVALESISTISAAYADIASELLALPVPKTLSPLHLVVVNDYSAIAATYTDLRTTLSDPVRGIVGLQTYEAKLDELGRVFTNIAQSLHKDGILFTKDEPGNAWSLFISPQ